MAEIPVEKKSGIPWWVWLILVLLILALLWFLFVDTSDEDEAAIADDSAIEQPVETDPLDDADMVGGDPLAEEMSLAAILASPQDYAGRDGFEGEFDTGDVPTDRGFWITEDGERLFALVEDQPREVRVDINPGQTLQISGGTLHDRSYIGSIGGEPVDDDTLAILEEQEVFLVVDESDIVIE